MVYVALLRGINVGGNCKVKMPRLKKLFESLGYGDVRTYINSGNVIFNAPAGNQKVMVKAIETAIQKEFGFSVKVIVRDVVNIKKVIATLPVGWVNNAEMKCDVMFLWEEADSPDLVKQLPVRPEIEDLKYVTGALLWRIDRKNVTKSGILKIAGTPIYKQMTIRNCNTVRKFFELMRSK